MHRNYSAGNSILNHYSWTTALVFRFLFRPAVDGLTRPSLAPPLVPPTAAAADSASAASNRRQRPRHACTARPFPTSSATFAHDDVPQVATAARRRAFSSSDQLTADMRQLLHEVLPGSLLYLEDVKIRIKGTGEELFAEPLKLYID